jgi:16S rRNA (guanine527-N7)-methyltransferase
MLTHHLLDSLAVIAPLRQQLAAMRAGQGDAKPVRLLDVGSGAGLPGHRNCHLLP